MDSSKSFVVFVGFHPNFRALSALLRVLLPSQGPLVVGVSLVSDRHEMK
jgi:hypothetical protein